MKNILVTMNETPYPPYSGGKVDFFYKLKIMKEMGYNVYLIYSYSNKNDNKDFQKIASQYVVSICSFPRKKNLKSNLSYVPYFILSNAPNNNEKIFIDKILKNVKIDTIIIDHLDSFLIGKYVISKYPNVKVIHRMHNNEFIFLYLMWLHLFILRTFSNSEIKYQYE